MPKKYNISFYNILKTMKPFLRRKLKNHKLNFYPESINTNNINKKTEILCVFVDSKLTPKILKQMPKLKLIITFSTGYDHISLNYAKKKHIPVCNVPSYGKNTVAQQAMALILALSRKLFESVKRVKEGRYDYHGLRGFDLKDKIIGIIGTGHIGINLIKMLSGFEVKIIAFDKFPNQNLAKKFNFKYVDFKTLLKKSNIISLHLPLLPSTKHIINLKAIKQMKKGVYIVNTARGGLIDNEALLWGLENNIIAGAGLDVLEGENYIQNPEQLILKQINNEDIKISLLDNILIDHPKTIITPHNAFNSLEAILRIAKTSVDNINNFISNNTQNNVY